VLVAVQAPPENSTKDLVIAGLTRNPPRICSLFMGLRLGGRNDVIRVSSNQKKSVANCPTSATVIGILSLKK